MADYFSQLLDFIAGYPQYAIAAVFVLALSEAIPLVGIVVPGSTLIIAIIALATGANVNPWLLLRAAVAGATTTVAIRLPLYAPDTDHHEPA